ncbi:TPA: hypothetical protein ACHIYT_006476 [Pseudomonas aeruginosa]
MAQNEAGGFGLSVALDVTIHGVPQQEAEKIVEVAQAPFWARIGRL